MNSKTPNSKISPKMKHSKNKNEDNVNVPAGANPSRKKNLFFFRFPIFCSLAIAFTAMFHDIDRINHDIDHGMSRKISIFCYL